MQPNPAIEIETPIKFYSKLVRWLSDCSLQSAMGAQWQGTLKNIQGIRAEELEIAFPMDILSDLFDEKLDRQSLLDVASDNLHDYAPTLINNLTDCFSPGLEFKRLSQEQVPQKVLLKHSFDRVIRCYQHASLGYRLMEVGYHDLLSSSPHWVLFDDKWNLHRRTDDKRADYSSSLRAMDDMYDLINHRFEGYRSRTSLNFYEDYSLKGGKNYKEWLLCLNYWKGKPFLDGHFDQSNVILHIRTSEWVDENGYPLLLVDELQSDWNASYRNWLLESDPSEIPFSAPPFKNEWHELGIKAAIMIAATSGFNRVGFTTGAIHCQRYGCFYEGLINLYDRLIPKALERFCRTYGANMDWSKVEAKMSKANLKYRRGEGWQITQSDHVVHKRIHHKQVANAYIESRSSHQLEKVRVVDLPQLLINQIKTEGLPLFGF